MAFANLDTYGGGSGRTGSKYLKIVTGVPSVIIIMDEHPDLVGKHWITDGTGRKIGLRCPGQDICPICQRNREINYNRDHPDYIQLQRRYRLNVLDLTPVIRCPECVAAYPATGDTSRLVCTNDTCGAQLGNIESEPLKEVKILERGRRLMEQFNALESTPHPFTGKAEKLQTYPIMLVATGSGRDMVITAIPQAMSDENLDSYEKLDLQSGLILEPEEIKYLIEGGSYNDVLSARRAQTQTPRESTAAETLANNPLASEDIPF